MTLNPGLLSQIPGGLSKDNSGELFGITNHLSTGRPTSAKLYLLQKHAKARLHTVPEVIQVVGMKAEKRHIHSRVRSLSTTTNLNKKNK